jgi:hypothetical protein
VAAVALRHVLVAATLPSLAIVAMETSRWVPDIFVRTSHVPSPGQVPSIR